MFPELKCKNKKEKKRRVIGFALETVIYRRDKDVSYHVEKKYEQLGKIMPQEKLRM